MPLNIKSLELHGYKTFAARYNFEFADGITAIVGPNGSGKSNIADALRWVLGEQSYSLLRAKRTEDMIFSGSEQRIRSGMASATVVFDNSSGWLPVDFTEVAITRRAYRDGRNDYLLNGQHVRLRDINELLAQSGLSERTYTILGQGLVDASLALKADERRRLFEEAAGVGLYRSRREEALRRLETTLRNLERVQDIMAELEPRLRSLERQSRRAREYAQAQADLRVLLRDWYGFHWRQTQKELADAREKLRRQEHVARQVGDAYRKSQQDHTAFLAQLQELRSQLNEWHHELARLQSTREVISKDLAVMDERQRAMLQAQQDILSEKARVEDEARLGAERRADADKEVERLQQEHNEAKTRAGSARVALQERVTDRRKVEELLHKVRGEQDVSITQKAELIARLDELQSRMDGQQARLSGVDGLIASALQIVNQAEQKGKAAQSALSKVADEHGQVEKSFQEAQVRATRLEQEHQGGNEQHVKLSTERARLQAQIEVLEQAEASLTGYADGTRFLLEAIKESRLNGRGSLSSMLEVQADLETAITAALGDALDAIVVATQSDEETALLLLDDDAKRAALLSMDLQSNSREVKEPDDAACLGVASRLVESPEEIQKAIKLLLGQTLVVKDRMAARRILSEQPQVARIVTLRGEVFRADGVILAGKPPRSGTLGRPRQRKELQSGLEAVERNLAALESVLADLVEQSRKAQDQMRTQQGKIQQGQAKLDEARLARQQASLELESAQRQYQWQLDQKEQLQAQTAQARDEIGIINSELIQVEARSAEVQKDLRSLSAQLSGLELEELQDQVTYWNTRCAVVERGLADARSRQDERHRETERFEVQRTAISRRQDEIASSLEELASKRDELRHQETEITGQVANLRLKVDPAERQLSETEKQEALLQEKELTAQRTLASEERSYGQFQMEQVRQQEVLDALREKIEDDFGLVQFTYAADVDGPVPLPFDGMVEYLNEVTELPVGLEEQVTQQRAMLRRMGPVNPEAQQEYESETERYTFLTEQVADLRKAEADLRQVIAELDELTQQEFSKTFDAVAKEFRDIFVRLFGGGSARLLLTDPDNLVDTGIDIEARLPGRREQGLALLSGGERSLTAIALVFALLKVSPTPVCVMDEVDAMLDEANVGRFRDLLLELSKDTQFVIITHNRNTVQAADVIYGVTMGRDSASQVISLRLDEVSDEYLRRG